MDAMSYERAANYLDVIRNMILHENELINQRLTWLFALQGLLFGAISFLWNTHLFPIVIISLVGIISSISIGYTLARGLNTIKELLVIAREFKDDLPKDMIFPPTIGAR